MFFIGIMGIDTKEENLKPVLAECPCCNESHLSLLNSYNRFHFFFLPIFKWGYKYYLHCQTCDSLYQIPEDKGYSISVGKDIQLNYWDLSPINVTRICKNCKNTLQSEFEYCPYCGNKQ